MIDKFAVIVSHFIICWSIYQLLKYEKAQADEKKSELKKRNELRRKAH